MTITQSALSAAFKDLERLNPEADFLNESAMSTVSTFIDTGCLALNAIMTGSALEGGIPSGRTVGFVGPSGCGKTMIMLKGVANAIKQGRYAVIWDSENAVDMVSAKNLGCDVSKIKHCPVQTIEDTRNQIVQFLDNVIANPDLHGKFILVIDSLANLSSAKELADADAGKSAVDMGLRAKQLKSLFRTVIYKLAKADCPLLFSNHVYDDPSAMFESIKKNQSGGKGPEYLSSIVVQMAAKQSRSKDEQSVAISKAATGGSVTGVDMRVLTTKNRFIPPFLETEIHVNFVKGMETYGEGLWQMAKDFGIIEGQKTYSVGEHKLGYKKDVINDREVWDKIILPPLELKLKKSLAFSCEGDDTILDGETEGE